jgi:hypothetical protein
MIYIEYEIKFLKLIAHTLFFDKKVMFVKDKNKKNFILL